MGNQNQDAGKPQPEGQPAGAPAPEGQQGAPSQPEFLTPEMQAWFKEQREQIKLEAANEAFSRAQSYYDKRNNVVRERMDDFEKNLTFFKKNVELTPAQEAQLRQQAYQEAVSAQEPSGQPVSGAAQPGALSTPATPAQEPTDPVAQLVTDMAADLETEFGVALEPNDPEVDKHGLNRDDVTPQQWLKSYRAALTEKKQRSGAPPDQAVGTPPGRAPSNLGGGGTPTSPVSQTMDPTELLKIARQQGKF